MNIQILVQVPVDPSKAYSTTTDVQVITDPTTVRAVLATIIACEGALDAVPEFDLATTDPALDGADVSD